MAPHPTSGVDRRRAVPLVVALVVLPVAVLAAIYLSLFSGRSSERFSIGDRPGSPTAGDPVGRWRVSAGSQAGYRVQEKLARLPTRSEAVGRTDQVTGEVVIERRDGQPVVLRGARVEVDMRSLRSDERRRDERLRTSGLETDRFPTAGFTTSFDVPIPQSGLTGARTRMILRGELTLHGVTRAIALPVEAQRRGATIEVVGALEVLMGDFRIHPPNVAGLVTVDPHGTMEYRLVLARA